MNRHDLTHDALDDLLRAAIPEPLVDDGFVARTLAAVDIAARSLPTHRRATPGVGCAIGIALALSAERRRHEAQARLWRWAAAGAFTGFALLVVAVLLSPAGTTISVPPPLQWFQLFTLLAVGATWFAWRQLRS